MGLKVLHLTVQAGIGGGPTHIAHLCRSLEEFGDECVLAAPAPHLGRPRYTAAHASFVHIPAGVASVRAVVRLRRKLKQLQPNILHTHGRGSLPLAGLALLGLRNARPTGWVHTMHGAHGAEAETHKAAVFVERQLLRRPDLVVAVSPSECERAAASKLGRPERVTTIPNGVEPSEPRTSPPQQKRIVVMGRSSHQKGFESVGEILGALDPLLDEHVEFHSYGPSPQDLGLAETYRNISVTTSALTDEPEQVLSNTSVLLSTSRWEGLPFLLLEAAALGVPIVATNVTGNRDLIIDRETGLLFDRACPVEAAKHIAFVLSNDQAAIDMGLKASELVRSTFSLRAMARKTKDTYDRVCTVDVGAVRR